MCYRVYIFLSITFLGWGFSQRYNFINYSVEDGLPQSQIYAIYQDHNEYIWFGTYGGGISKFNGIEFENFNEESGLTCSFIRCIIEYNSQLLIGTDDGLFIYTNKQFYPFSHPELKPGKYQIRTITVDKENNVWVGGIGMGLYKFKDGKLKKLQFNSQAGDNVYCVYADSRGKVWVGFETGFCLIENTKFTFYSKINKSKFTALRCITEDKQGNVWLGSYLYGVAMYNRSTYKTYSMNDGLGSNTVNTIVVDNNNVKWISTANGITKLNDSNIKTFTTDHGLCSNFMVSSLEDKNKNIWFGSSGGGVSKFDNEKFQHFSENDNIGKLVYSIKQDNRGDMWFGNSNGGVTKYDGVSFTVFNKENNFTNSKIRALFCDSDSTYWFGSLGQGVFYYNGKEFTNYQYKDGLCGSYISGITSDNLGNIWFSSIDNGIGYYNKKDKIFYRYKKADGIASNRINTIASDIQNNIWIGSSDAGVDKISIASNNSILITHYDEKLGLASNKINTIIPYNAKVYIGTSGSGISVLNQNGKFTNWNKTNGLNSNIIYSLVFDRQGNLWAGSEKGIDKIVHENDKIVRVFHYGKEEGFYGVENTLNSSCIDSLGNLWFGTISGANKFNPKLDLLNATPPKLHLTSINIFFDKVENTSYGCNYSNYESLSNNLFLPYDKNHISFEFIGLNYTNSKAVKYKWRLIGDNDKWSPELTKREATFSNLKPGEYTFELNACNENGIWLETPLSFKFTINQPFWNSTYFLVTIIFVVSFIIGLIIFSFIKSFKKKNKEEKERLEMSKNILELQQATSRLQMNPHFLFNSLNSIQGYIASNNTADAKWYLSKFAKLMRQILDNAKEEYISLREEINILENYVILEKMRMNDKFDYSIICDASIDMDEVEIPPMIIQPFVENSILHGLKHKEGKGKIDVNFFLNSEFLCCEIIDNGIGRNAAIEMKNKSSAEHKSSAVSITMNRLKLLNKTSDQESLIKFIDLVDSNNQPCGTKVMIQIPL